MKTNSIKSLLAAVAALAVSTSAYADFTMTFDSGPLSTELSGFQWTAGPAGWAGGGAAQSTSTAMGWQGWVNVISFDLASGHQPDMTAIAASGNGRISFDILFDSTSLTSGASGWYGGSLAFNSSGGAGWTQFDNPAPWGDNIPDPVGLIVKHFDYSFAQAGWTPGTSWFQLNISGNGNGTTVENFYLDNLSVYSVPEPSTFALAGLGSAALLIFRRRK